MQPGKMDGGSALPAHHLIARFGALRKPYRTQAAH
jgi:hypothetical protein